MSRLRWIGRISQAQWVVIAMIIGVALGWMFPDRPGAGGFRATDLQVLSNVFLRMVKSLVAPLLFATLVVGIAGHGHDMKRVGTLALRSLLYFEVVTALALAVGLLAVNLAQPGSGVTLGAPTPGADTAAVTRMPAFGRVLEHIVPQSFIDAAARNDALQITFFSIVFAVALARVQGPVKALMLTFCHALSEVMFEFTPLVMRFAPIGVGGAIAATVGKSGIGVLRHLGALVFTLYGALIVFALVVLLPIAIAFRVPVRRFWSATKAPWLIAFSTASSEAALPLALANMERIGVPRHIASFVLPAGYTFNMDGTTLYLAMASMFVAQAAGITLSVSQQVLMMMTLMLTSKGTAAVPRASLVVLSGALTQFGLPLEGIAVVLGVDAFMDMARTSLNVVGNCLASVVLARWDGSFDVAPAVAPRDSRRIPLRVAESSGR
ncbi:MAG TPA: dicarboxylate/amino acid:cation symporter [Gemmatimonadaceae bacterium]|jgi:proton glutamate symport protein|nr:dicarboxylate/amino acid:cation symporter [Gemmatimonadaceae bacterium]